MFLPLATLVVALSALTAPTLAQAPDDAAPKPIRTLIITGHNNHNWMYTSRVHQETLSATGRFQVDITENPSETLADPARLAQYALFVLDYNDMHAPKRWGDKPEAAFLAAVERGAGVVAIHSAVCSFPGWEGYERMLGLMWRDGTGHGPAHEFKLRVVDTDHPITRGMSPFSTRDELYHRLVAMHGAKPRILLNAMSETSAGGSGQTEPMGFTTTFGNGRVFSTPLGHVWTNDRASKSAVTNPGFRALLCRGAEWAATGAVTLPTNWSDRRTHNQLTADEKADGWSRLFDGVETSAFRGFKKQGFPDKGWVVRDGTLVHQAGAGGGDLITVEQFADFEFRCEWKAAKGANSGIIYRCTEDKNNTWETGPEMQILDDAAHSDAANSLHTAGALYDLFAPAADVARPAGEWNSVRIIVRGPRIVHWLNGVKIVDIGLDTPEYATAHQKSKWTGMPDFAKRDKGHIALQDHGDEVAFRNLKIRVLR